MAGNVWSQYVSQGSLNGWPREGNPLGRVFSLPALRCNSPVSDRMIRSGFSDILPPGYIDINYVSVAVDSFPDLLKHGLHNLLVILWDGVIDPSVRCLVSILGGKLRD